MNTMSFWLSSMLVVVLATAAQSEAGQCEGRCSDGNGNVMVVSAGYCDDASTTCHAGCDTSAREGARPYAECRSRATGQAVSRHAVEPTGNRRERQGVGGTVVE